MIREAIVLAGGLGTRLRSVVADTPKCMAPVAGRPFIDHVIDFAVKQGISKFIFSLGYKHEVIEEHLKTNYPTLSYTCSIEQEPLGTGGAIYKSASLASAADVLVLNGDTLFAVDIASLSEFHSGKQADCTLALKTMYNSDRYGVVETDLSGRIVSFHEKKWHPESVINGGVYALKIESFLAMDFPEVFSFEKDFLEKEFATLRMFGMKQDGYFIDIGVPADYERAQTELDRT